MLNIISCILFSIAANFDNIIIGMLFGLKKIHIPLTKNIFISLFTTVITVIAMLFSNFLFLVFDAKIINLIGSISLLTIGFTGIIVNILKKGFLSNKKKNENENENNNNDKKENEISINSLKIKNLITIIFSLSINNIGTGIAASATGINIIFSFFSNLVSSFFALLIGNNLGKNILNSYITKYSDVICYLLIIFLGVIQLVF